MTYFRVPITCLAVWALSAVAAAAPSYNGGPLLGSVKVQVVYWVETGATQETYGDPGTYDSKISAWWQSLLSSSYFRSLGEYNTPTGGVWSGVYAGSYGDSNNLSIPNLYFDSKSLVTADQLEQWIAKRLIPIKAIAAPDSHTVYVIYLPARLQFANSVEGQVPLPTCNFIPMGSGSEMTWSVSCGAHRAFIFNGQLVPYIVVPWCGINDDAEIYLPIPAYIAETQPMCLLGQMGSDLQALEAWSSFGIVEAATDPADLLNGQLAAWSFQPSGITEGNNTGIAGQCWNLNLSTLVLPTPQDRDPKPPGDFFVLDPKLGMLSRYWSQANNPSPIGDVYVSGETGGEAAEVACIAPGSTVAAVFTPPILSNSGTQLVEEPAIAPTTRHVLAYDKHDDVGYVYTFDAFGNPYGGTAATGVTPTPPGLDIGTSCVSGTFQSGDGSADQLFCYDGATGQWTIASVDRQGRWTTVGQSGPLQRKLLPLGYTDVLSGQFNRNIPGDSLFFYNGVTGDGEFADIVFNKSLADLPGGSLFDVLPSGDYSVLVPTTLNAAHTLPGEFGGSGCLAGQICAGCPSYQSCSKCFPQPITCVGPDTVTSGDVNGDGIPDLIFYSRTLGTIRVVTLDGMAGVKHLWLPWNPTNTCSPNVPYLFPGNYYSSISAGQFLYPGTLGLNNVKLTQLMGYCRFEQPQAVPVSPPQNNPPLFKLEHWGKPTPRAGPDVETEEWCETNASAACTWSWSELDSQPVAGEYGGTNVSNYSLIIAGDVGGNDLVFVNPPNPQIVTNNLIGYGYAGSLYTDIIGWDPTGRLEMFSNAGDSNGTLAMWATVKTFLPPPAPVLLGRGGAGAYSNSRNGPGAFAHPENVNIAVQLSTSGPQIDCRLPGRHDLFGLNQGFQDILVGTTVTQVIQCANIEVASPDAINLLFLYDPAQEGRTARLGSSETPPHPSISGSTLFTATYDNKSYSVAGLLPGASANIAISYSPSAVLSKLTDSATLTIKNNGGQGYPVQIFLEGSSRCTPEHAFCEHDGECCSPLHCMTNALGFGNCG